ncbi:MAG: [protein-PII] uridylyltransferase [Rhodocyclaceae bacterium]|nr:MAG: [protein-PII] uridylyltransferase [Rhodocyclaceae bacterium]
MATAPAPNEVVKTLVGRCRLQLQADMAALTAAYLADGDDQALLHGRTQRVDAPLVQSWRDLDMPSQLALVAVGGYGRGELFPSSDVDLLILIPNGYDPAQEPRIEQLIGLLWDMGLDVGHSVRTPEECAQESAKDITVQTALLEARLLTGDAQLFAQLEQHLAAVLDPAHFFNAKRLEQEERYARYNDTPYSLEPNCKESPGGLRDLQIILWVAKAANLGQHWHDLIQEDILTVEDAAHLTEAEHFLNRLRIHLHLLLKRREERLLFDHQEALAQALGFQRTETKRASEVLMQSYYRNAKLVTQLNTLVLQNLDVRLIKRPAIPPLIIDEHFQVLRDRLDIRDVRMFSEQPITILKSFLLLEQRHELQGMTSRTLRALWRARHRIDDDFRADLGHRALFLKLFQQRHLIRELRLMNQFGILGRYLPAFGRIVGQMQHDLFHVYTVDQHIMQVIRNLRRFAMPEFAHEYPLCSRLFSAFDRSWLLYIAALFHDIAKGRGGDHSKEGMADARHFCADHGIIQEDCDLVVFLVEHHLNMSAIAQKHDVTDPEVITAFAETVRDERRLTALYLLTVADIRGTSPKVWNAWKGKLLEDLFRATRRHLQGDRVTFAGMPAQQVASLSQLRLYGLRSGVEKELWQHLDTTYFLRHDADEIAWHTRTLYHRVNAEEPVVKARLNPIGEGLQVMAYVADQPDLFARLCGFFSRFGYSIVDAKIHTTSHGYALDSFVLLDSQEHLPYRDMIALIEHDLVDLLKTRPPLEAPAKGRLPRQVKHFPITPEVSIRADEKGNRYVLSLAAADRAGLLYAIARLLAQHGISLHAARVNTLGERVEDTFLISGHELEKSTTLVKLEQELLEVLQV